MTIGVGGSTADVELERLAAIRSHVELLPREEFERRLDRARRLMQRSGLDAVYLCAGSSLYYFTGLRWHLTERMAGAVITTDNTIEFIAPEFELGTFRQHMLLEGDINTWQEQESPFTLFAEVLSRAGINRGRIGLDEATPFHHVAEILGLDTGHRFVDARPVTAGCRTRKSEAEIDVIRTAMGMTLEVHKSAAGILEPGISTADVATFIDQAHKTIGAPGGSTFCAVQFGEATAYPHGVPYTQTLADADIILIDTGCLVQGYHSDITRTYVFGDPSVRHREVWDAEKEAQSRAFDAAQIGATCGDVDTAARRYLASLGYGPGYATPGLPHRTGHGIGLDIHEWPYLVKDSDTPLAAGMCFSNEPMLCLPGEFGVRLEDHFYVTEQGPAWFTTPSPSIDDPFAAAS